VIQQEVRELAFPEAINLAMLREMENDPAVFAFGVDVQDHKRTFGSGKGMVEHFGPRRYFGSPLSEAGVTGVAIGAALCGLRPIHIHARADFMLLAMNQLVNMASNKRYLSDGRLKVPLVVRAMIGRSWGQGAQHSKSMHSVLAHFPGLKVVLPSSPQDGYSLLRTAIRDDNPVIFFEHRWLYFTRGPVDEAISVPIGTSKVRREGDDVTIVAVSWMTVEALQAAEILARHGVEAEVVDVRTVVPLDIETITASVRKTGRVIIADYDWTFCGFSAELAAQITESCFASLKTPPIRIGFAPVPCPTTRPLENLFYPTAKDVVQTVTQLMGLPEIDLSHEEFHAYEKLFKGPF
jgi:acetoin:2,6-dichlorophenolindophenol oxidoreductase subunit beta